MPEKAQCDQFAGQYPGSMVLQLTGKFYNAFDDSAKALSAVTGYKINETSKGRAKCGFPSEALDKVTGLLKKSEISYTILENGIPVTSWNEGRTDNLKTFAEKCSIRKASYDETVKKEIPVSQHTQTIYLQGTGADLRNAMISLKGEIDRLTGLGITVRSVATEHENIPGQGCMVYAVAVCGGKE